MNIRGDSKRRKEDLDTGLEVQTMEKGLNRVLYYEVRLRSVDGVRQLALTPKEKKVDVVTLRSAHTGAVFTLPGLTTIRVGKGYVYPDYEAGSIKEEDIFSNSDPSAFENPDLVPEAPEAIRPVRPHYS